MAKQSEFSQSDLFPFGTEMFVFVKIFSDQAKLVYRTYLFFKSFLCYIWRNVLKRVWFQFCITDDDTTNRQEIKSNLCWWWINFFVQCLDDTKFSKMVGAFFHSGPSWMELPKLHFMNQSISPDYNKINITRA